MERAEKGGGERGGRNLIAIHATCVAIAVGKAGRDHVLPHQGSWVGRFLPPKF